MLDLPVTNKPFLAILGTSHTAGDCDDGANTHLKMPYGKLLANKLGLEFVNLGMSGASNFDLLEMANELASLDLLKNCALFLLEPRLGSGTLNISRDPLLEYHHNDVFQHNNTVYPTLLMTEEFFNLSESYTPTLSYGYFSIWNGSDLSPERIRQRVSGGYPDNIAGISNTEFSDFSKYLKQKVYYEAGTCYNKLHDLTVIQSIKNIITGAGTKQFGWLNFNGAPANHPLLQEIYKYNLPLGHCPSDGTNQRELSIITYIEHMYSKKFVEQRQCLCGHFDQQIHEIIADILYEKLNERTDYREPQRSI